MRIIAIGSCLFLLVGCSLGKDTRRAEGQASLTVQEIETLRQEPVNAREGSVVKEYEDFLNRYHPVDPALKTQALKRLGDLYLDGANRRFLKAMEAYEAHPDGPPPLVDDTRAIETYEELLRFSPDYRENDQVLYALARAYAEMGDREKAVAAIERLRKDYPGSRYRQEASFRLGEYYFDQRRYGEAAAAYEQSLTFKDPFFVDKAQYKLGWTYFNMKEYEKAIDHFLRLVNQKVTSEADLSAEKGSLVWEALTYVATSFRMLGGAVPLSTYFRGNGAPLYEKELYTMIGNQYMSDGDFSSAAGTYRMFIREHPLHPMAPIFLSYILEIDEKQKDPEAAEQARIQLVTDYASRSPWYRANDEAARARSRPLVKAALYRLALSAHSRAQAVKDDEDYRKAAGWYRQFLTEFPQEKEAPDVHLFLAETLFTLQEFSQAGAEYVAAAYGDPKNGVNEKAAYDAVVAYEKMKSRAGDDRVIDLSKRFAAAFPRDPKAPALLLKAGEILYEEGRYDETLGVLKDFPARFPGNEGATTALKLVAHSYTREGRFEEARQGYRQTLASLPPSDLKGRREIADLLAASVYKQGEDRKRKNRSEEAARLFEDVADEAPQSDLAPRALFEAAEIREGMKQPEKAIAIYRRLVLLSPDSTLSGQALVQVGLLYENEEKWIQSADAYVSAAERIRDESLVPHLLFTAGLYYEKGAQWERCYESFSRFSERFPQNPDAAEALFKMAHARQNQKKNRESLKLFEKVEQQYPATPFAAEALFQIGEEAFRNFKTIRLEKPLNKTLKKKAKAMEKAVDLYRKAIETRYADVVTASSYRLGEIFENFKSSLLEAELPRNLNKEEQEEYRFQLEEKAFPFEQKAVEAYFSNVRRIQDQNSPYNDWIKKSYERLAELRPALYRRPERTERVVTDIGQGHLSTQATQDPPAKMVQAR
ncbi:MAG TPA: tetratricopeptide repeat protein [Nitrospiria bacterium]|jgi:TolA-binding protein|nr:tetratricopeptide repeat protein [Nitrospiria bacterium]